MNHDEYRINVSQHLDGELDRNEEMHLFSHLAGCEECRDFLRQAIQLRMHLHAAPQRLMPESHSRKPLSTPAFHKIRANVFSLLWQKRVPLPVAAIVVFMVLTGTVGLSSWWFSSDTQMSNGSQAIFVMPEVIIERSSNTLMQ
ncbi:MAG: zf-HC2 domain-containing protein [bacterium]